MDNWLLSMFSPMHAQPKTAITLFAFACQSCSESCAFQAVAAVVDFVYQIKAIQKKAKKRKVLVGWSFRELLVGGKERTAAQEKWPRS